MLNFMCTVIILVSDYFVEVTGKNKVVLLNCGPVHSRCGVLFIGLIFFVK